MRDVLLISDDPRRGERLLHDLGTFCACRLHDLYDDRLPAGAPELIVSDVSTLTSDAIRRLQLVLGRVRPSDAPFLFLIHGNAARAEAQARALGASGTLGAGALTEALLAAFESLQSATDPAVPAVERYADAARHVIANIFVPGRRITPSAIDTGTGLIARAVRETSVGDWVRAVWRFDDATHQHCLLVAGLATAFAESLGLAAADCHRLTKAALLHDVGKIHVSRDILNKPGSLTAGERAEMQTHPARGFAMLSGSGFDDGLLSVVRSHHEMLDGSGYPDGLKGAQIPDLVRLVTVCDIYGALIERRAYKPPMPGAKAYAILQDMGSRLDTDLVRTFRPVAATFQMSGNAREAV